MIIDYITAIFRAIIEKTLASDKGREFILKKVTILLLAASTYILDTFVLQNDTGNLLIITVLSFYIANEGIGILENAAAMGLPIPNALANILKREKEI
ncbi:MAG: phage holin family protein [Defluviitaleaceae bacterium]|nr:phage holin family protein [Defluviitaleaceae bacterium]